jgi:hemolysin III
VGALLAALGLAALVWRALDSADRVKLPSLVVYGSSLVALYVASTLYHAARGRLKALFRKLDHVAIYVLIAGTYTPFALVTLRDSWGVPLLAAVWTLAALGIALELSQRARAAPASPRPRIVRRRVAAVGLYLAMGWLALGALRPLARALEGGGLTLLLAGGVLYTVGTLFYALDRRYAHAHGVFHVFVLAGSACHYAVVWFWVA